MGSSSFTGSTAPLFVNNGATGFGGSTAPSLVNNGLFIPQAGSFGQATTPGQRSPFENLFTSQPVNRLSSFVPKTLPQDNNPGGAGNGTDNGQRGENGFFGNAVSPDFGSFMGSVATAAGLTSGLGILGIVDDVQASLTGKTFRGFINDLLGDPLGLNDPAPFGHTPSISENDIGAPNTAAQDVDVAAQVDSFSELGGPPGAPGAPGVGSSGFDYGDDGLGGGGPSGGGDSPGGGGTGGPGGSQGGNGPGDDADGYAYGGEVRGPGGPRDDQVPMGDMTSNPDAMGSDGEYVMDAQTVQAFGGPETFKNMQRQGQGFAPDDVDKDMMELVEFEERRRGMLKHAQNKLTCR